MNPCGKKLVLWSHTTISLCVWNIERQSNRSPPPFFTLSFWISGSWCLNVWLVSRCFTASGIFLSPPAGSFWCRTIFQIYHPAYQMSQPASYHTPEQIRRFCDMSPAVLYVPNALFCCCCCYTLFESLIPPLFILQYFHSLTSHSCDGSFAIILPAGCCTGCRIHGGYVIRILCMCFLSR